MSAEDELPPCEIGPMAEFPAELLAEIWDDDEPDHRNLEIIGWWLSLPDAQRQLEPF